MKPLNFKAFFAAVQEFGDKKERLLNLLRSLFTRSAIACVFLSLVWVNPAGSMTLEVQGDTLFATGGVTDDLKQFEEAFAKHSIKTVVFVNSPGGFLWDGLRVGRLIASKGINTVTAGTCVSACSVMFMGGKERRFSDAFHSVRTYVGIHGPHNLETKQVDTRMAPDMYAFYKQQIGDKFNSAVMNQALYDMKDAGSLMYLLDPIRNKNKLAYHCVSAQSLRANCTDFPDVDAFTLGVITHKDFAKVNLPASFKDQNLFWGRALEVEHPDLEGALKALGAQACATQTCQTDLLAYQSRTNNRAIAVAQTSKGIGWSQGISNQNIAINRAIYGCNHIQGLRPRLCEVKFLNGFDVSAIYDDAASSSERALKTLKPPSEKAYAGEQFGGGFTRVNGFRFEKFVDITPSSLDGIKLIQTQELAALLMNDGYKGVQMIDVQGHFLSIPGSQPLLFGGSAFADPKLDEAFEARFQGLLALLAPDLSKPVVFFCSGRNCWNSVNAALRAKKVGYQQVIWYRGGVEAWKEAGLPLVQAVPRAVAN